MSYATPARITVEALNLRHRLALLTDDTTCPITTLIDQWGDETTVADEAVTAVCGSEEQGWFTVLLSAFEEPKFHG